MIDSVAGIHVNNRKCWWKGSCIGFKVWSGTIYFRGETFMFLQDV